MVQVFIGEQVLDLLRLGCSHIWQHSWLFNKQ